MGVRRISFMLKILFIRKDSSFFYDLHGSLSFTGFLYFSSMIFLFKIISDDDIFLQILTTKWFWYAENQNNYEEIIK